MAVCAGLDGPVLSNRSRGLGRLAARAESMADEAVVGATRPELPLVAGFLRGHRIGLALIVVLGLLGVIIAFIAAAWSRDRVAAWLFVPYAAWVAFASVLNAAILVLN